LSTLFSSFIRKFFLAAALFSAANSHAGLIVISGELVGATGVVISGLGTYDVSFEDGSCASVFSGCDELSDFGFSSVDQTISAGQALLEQVFVDSELGLFDSMPALIRGCEDENKCIALIPNKLTESWVFSQNIINSATESGDKVSFSSNLGFEQSIIGRSNTTFAVFTQVMHVPTPASALLFGFALIALVSFKRKK
jgi:hypothetical protein